MSASGPESLSLLHAHLEKSRRQRDMCVAVRPNQTVAAVASMLKRRDGNGGSYLLPPFSLQSFMSPTLAPLLQ
jgi:hypothetical protein